MGKRTIILSEDQVNEIIGYCDGAEQDFSENGSSEVFSGQHMDNCYADPVTTDDIAKKRVSDIGGLWKDGGACRNVVMRESSEFEKLKAFLMEDNEFFDGKTQELSDDQANKLSNAPSDSVASNAVENGVKIENMPKYMQRFRDAKQKAINGDSSTFDNMGGQEAMDILGKVYDSNKFASKVARDAKPVGSKIKSAPKQANNGKAHSPSEQNGAIITYKD